MDTIANEVCIYYDINLNDLKGRSRIRKIVEAREIFCMLSKVFTKVKTSVIARYLNRDHSTITNAIDKYGDDYKTDKAFRISADAIANNLMSYYYETQKYCDA